MSASDETSNGGGGDEMAVDAIPKKNEDTLFIQEDEVMDNADSRGNKRLKLDHDSTYSTQEQSISPSSVENGASKGDDGKVSAQEPSYPSKVVAEGMKLEHDGSRPSQQLLSPLSNSVTDMRLEQDGDCSTQEQSGPVRHTAYTINPNQDITRSAKEQTAALPNIVNGMVPPYNASNAEGRPRLAIYHESFAQAEMLIKQACDHFIAIYEQVKESGYVNEEMDKLVLRRLVHNRSPQKRYTSVKPISFLGPAGIGKSSGLNCYLSQAAAAVESDSGSRGTSIVHEYSAARPDQTSQFVVVVRYHAKRVIAMQIESHCQNVFNFMNLSASNTEELDEEEIRELKQKHDTALDFFITLLRDLEEFESEEAALDYFQDRKADSEADVTSDLQGLVQNFLATRGVVGENNEEVYDAESEAELTAIFQKISGPSGVGTSTKGQPSPWPLVSKIEIHKDTDLLNAGVVLADTPGVTDTNQTVVLNTRRYLKAAGTILVFANPTRVTKNPDLDGNLRECIRLSKMNETYLIITNIDHKTSFKATEKGQLPQEDQDCLSAAENDAQSLRNDLAKVSQMKESATSIEQYKEIDNSMRQLEIKIRLADMRIKQVSIEIRNRDIERAVKGKFRELQGSKKAPDLKVIFTSNSEYQKHLAGYDVKDPPILDIKGTGIPAVRAVLYAVPAYGKLNTLRMMVRKNLPTLFNSIVGILTKSPLERKNDVKKLIVKILDGGVDVIKDAVSTFEADFKERIQKAFEENNSKWQDAADVRLQEWQKLKAVSFAAFTRRGGVFKPKNCDEANWNSEIRDIMRNKVNNAINLFEDDVETCARDTISEISNLYQKLQDELQGCEAFQGVDEKPFFQYFHSIKESIMRHVQNLIESLKEGISTIRAKTTIEPHSEEEGSDSYTTIIMQATYDQCKLVSNSSLAPPVSIVNKKGKIQKRGGMHAARVEEIRKRFNGTGDVTGIFKAIYLEVSKAFDEALVEWRRNADQRMLRGSVMVLNDFDSRFDTQEIKTEDNEEHVELLKKEAYGAIGFMEGKINDLLVECEKYEKA